MTQEAAPQPALEAAARELHEIYHNGGAPWDGLHESQRAVWRRDAQAFLDRHSSAAQQKVPEGEWRWVPVVPTYEMKRAGEKDCWNDQSTAASIFTAMLAAAPAKPQPPETGGLIFRLLQDAELLDLKGGWTTVAAEIREAAKALATIRAETVAECAKAARMESIGAVVGLQNIERGESLGFNHYNKDAWQARLDAANRIEAAIRALSPCAAPLTKGAK